MKSTGIIIALAMTWDGVRCPVRSLPLKARAFLAGESTGLPSRKTLTTLFANYRVKEVRVCWVPVLKGGNDVLCTEFTAPSDKRLSFRIARTIRLGDLLGVAYRRAVGK